MREFEIAIDWNMFLGKTTNFTETQPELAAAWRRRLKFSCMAILLTIAASVAAAVNHNLLVIPCLITAYHTLSAVRIHRKTSYVIATEMLTGDDRSASAATMLDVLLVRFHANLALLAVYLTATSFFYAAYVAPHVLSFSDVMSGGGMAAVSTFGVVCLVRHLDEDYFRPSFTTIAFAFAGFFNIVSDITDGAYAWMFTFVLLALAMLAVGAAIPFTAPTTETNNNITIDVLVPKKWWL